MGSCRGCCHDKRCHELRCHCTCRKKDHCDHHQKLLKDCICAEWTIPSGQSQTVFQTSGHRQIFASGFITLQDSHSDYVTARFFLDGYEVGAPIRVFKDSSVAFSLTKFDRITVECANANDVEERCEGEICLTVRSPM
ncbi:S-Ena type endospore appendage [Pseudogracilibacillus auburnensis]|uniref:Uncharacterized protein DUF3992 n=1 Tax=Pseudogracilibacillus auburnensis TaxID=1494959 RepID=A0A2V3W8E0_9BACI|nr:S-Ena type endospore appendage [Pseudogracilibacillus auburnensis]MBO1001192.1 hypothetical protein [Pseudogracilibacillus auburnensis]PXW90627.1 uncharacterized protein DUF3992 [Pseudogracilibacillus auburnensis]